MLTTQLGIVRIFWAHSPISSNQNSSWCPFLDSHLTTYTWNIGIQIIVMLELGTPTHIVKSCSVVTMTAMSTLFKWHLCPEVRSTYLFTVLMQRKSPFLFVNCYHWFLYEVYGIQFIQTYVVIHIWIAPILQGGLQLKIEEVSVRCSRFMRRFWSCNFEFYNNMSYWWRALFNQYSRPLEKELYISGNIFLSSQSFSFKDIPWERYIVLCFFHQLARSMLAFVSRIFTSIIHLCYVGLLWSLFLAGHLYLSGYMVRLVLKNIH
jgi:hypothetical protein